MNIKKVTEDKQKIIYETVTTGLKVELNKQDILILERALGNADFNTVLDQLQTRGYNISRDEIVNCITNLYNAFRQFNCNA